MYQLITLIALPLLTSAAFVVPRVWYGPNSLTYSSTGENILPEQHALFPIDHNNVSAGTFSNRYWVNSTFYELGGPVFVYDAGAGDANDAVPLLTENGLQSAVMQLARAFHGAGVVLEHRYYGQSIPFAQKEVNGTLRGNFTDLTPSELQYFTLDQAVADLLFFPQVFSITNSSAFGNVAGSDGLKPENTPYIILGGGIGGVRAAVARLNGESRIFAGWASSAPVQAQISYPQYFDSMANAIPSNCSADLRDTRFIADSIINGTTLDDALVNVTAHTLRHAVALAIDGDYGDLPSVIDEEQDGEDDEDDEDSEEVSTLQIMREFSQPMSFFQVDGVIGANAFCNHELVLAGKNGSFDGTSAKFGGFVTIFDPFDRLDVYLRASDDFATESIPLETPDSSQGRGSEKSSLARRDVDAAGTGSGDQNPPVDADLSGSDQKFADGSAWMFQYCTQFGLFLANDNPGNNTSIQSAFVNTAALQAECSEFLKSRTLAPVAKPQIEQILKYKGWNMKPTQTFFTNGAVDPWLSATVASADPDAPKRLASKAVPAFNQVNSDGGYFGLVHQDNVHAQDMVVYEDSFPHAQTAFNESVLLFASALQEWLKSYKPQIQAAEAAADGSANGAITTNSPFSTWNMGILAALIIILA